MVSPADFGTWGRNSQTGQLLVTARDQDGCCAAADVSGLHSSSPASADLWNFSPPRHLHTEQAGATGTSAHPARPGGPALSKQQPGQLREAWFLTHCHAQIH